MQDRNVTESVKQGVRDKDFPQCAEQQVNDENYTGEQCTSTAIDKDFPYGVE